MWVGGTIGFKSSAGDSHTQLALGTTDLSGGLICELADFAALAVASLLCHGHLPAL